MPAAKLSYGQPLAAKPGFTAGAPEERTSGSSLFLRAAPGEIDIIYIVFTFWKFSFYIKLLA
ncbi:hypothetical protein DCCM_4480 [Desulfocucumis palustris]|uniref:Uncharacterized protein n=1 Tax=Desulfocucumis palustris TaxID=1898651 RepID=A0A2L2XG96_9FIRM|nr:hypothetical protein DCCM_4480 [Desulfocucumis palustris]